MTLVLFVAAAVLFGFAFLASVVAELSGAAYFTMVALGLALLAVGQAVSVRRP
jgi:hypothetical protein